MRLKTLLAAGLLALSSSTWATVEKYAIDIPGQHAFIQFKIQHLGYSWLLGDFRKFDGSFVYDTDDASNSSVNVIVDTTSLDSNHAERDKHLKGKDFLDVKQFPKAIFTSTNVSNNSDGSMTITGELELHGVKKQIEIEAHKIGRGADPWGGFRAGFEGTTTLKLADFGMTTNLGPASTHVQLNLFIEGVRQ